MEKYNQKKLLYNSSVWDVFAYFFQHPEKGHRRKAVAKALPKTSQAAVYKALGQLDESKIIIEQEEGLFEVNHDLAWIRYMMIVDSLITVQPLVDQLADLSLKIILFGSRANAEYTSDSDFDLLVVSTHEEDVRRIAARSHLAEKIQLILKTPEEWIDLYQTSPEFYDSIQQGITLWQRK